ncbi:RusA family crossover junction endodeoxyribonuclease [Methylobacterium isbiliense]|jgi:Holliday junction resolvase RusA-like endonuclease|uniref:Uncharacterized protein n=2 Tax=Methylobacterium isbiliense TaxID=315478 RepID=A0ABQ4SAH3_9HYPH|nr:RusA family crossover junction endodeoxyribonuclease [Methylobacterium isbiliense]MDN3625524.1 RusA family crossover junction endodeoxyribonuclease [Methylobacterium isbiliense]GJD98670.1 hypothetical protein GMJLKIPL_0581 [Methylobacterium isbiliense]
MRRVLHREMTLPGRSGVGGALGRRRPPVGHDLPFTYWVFGRPVSTRNDDGSKPAALPRWRGTVTTALTEAVEASTKGRGLRLVTAPVQVRIDWLSLDPFDPSQPDVDNMLKPLIDALNGTVIGDDRQVHRILAQKGSVNATPDLDVAFADIQDDERFTRFGEVIVVSVAAFEEQRA